MPEIKTFRDREKERYKSINPKLFDPGADYYGSYKKIMRSFCLADSSIGANLYKNIRVSAMEYFARRGIQWHDGLIERLVPSNHLCCSQSCCVNFLFPMAYNPHLIKKVFQSVDSINLDIKEILPIEDDCINKKEKVPYIVFEWIGTKDYLNEQKRKGGTRTRGANYTSADFAFIVLRNDGKKHLVLGEWKYTEEYGKEDKGKIKARLDNYQEAFNKGNGVFPTKYKEFYRALFFEPFYQLLRLQLMAQEMKLGKELGADEVSVLHICPKANREFRERVTSDYLANNEEFRGYSVPEIWKKLVPADKFFSFSVEELLVAITTNASEVDPDWTKYLSVRYGW